MDVVPFEPAHLRELSLQPAQAYLGEFVGDWEMYGEILAIPGLAYTGIVDGGVVGCGGVYPLHFGCGLAWALLSPLFPKYKLAVTREVRRFLDGALDDERFWRIQTPVRADFARGHGWARVLGFKEESLMKKYGPDRADYMLYARVV